MSDLKYVMVCGAAAVLAASCTTAEPDDPEAAEAHSELISDPTGAITISITQCTAVAVSQGIRSTSCSVPAGFVLVGGGGQIEGQPTPGALLQQSRPSGQSWLVQAKDHLHTSSYTLRAAAIGLKLAGVDPTTLRNMVVVTAAVASPAAARSTVSVSPPSGHIVLGGGAAASSPGHEQLLVASAPLAPLDEPVGWTAVSKDHVDHDPGTVVAYVISMPQCPPGFTGGCLATTVRTQTSSSSDGYRPTTLFTTGPVSGVGARANYGTGAGRMLTSIWPTDTGNNNVSTLLANSKDHDIHNIGTTTGFQISLHTL